MDIGAPCAPLPHPSPLLHWGPLLAIWSCSWGQNMGNMASTPPHADVQSGGKKDISYVDYNEANTTSMATTICTYLSQSPLERTSRLSHENSGGVPLLWVCTSVASASEAMLV